METENVATLITLSELLEFEISKVNSFPNHE